ncbi:hypothetical protein QBC37DRAFT_55923 [Rhypophila decipiens]|uniref:Secreted protein n=1 Tax=Rhypophila decipiens TaxID=261697 RepID=A0AAN6XYH7_9PEZI|nr:hypothetical protein QBC37DRAFT_55923 [Rhypophila decipiens]
MLFFAQTIAFLVAGVWTMASRQHPGLNRYRSPECCGQFSKFMEQFSVGWRRLLRGGTTRPKRSLRSILPWALSSTPYVPCPLPLICNGFCISNPGCADANHSLFTPFIASHALFLDLQIYMASSRSCI